MGGRPLDLTTADIARRCERIEADAWSAMHAALSPADRAALGVAAERMDAALSLMSPRFDSAMVNRTVGLGLERPLTEPMVDRLRDEYVARDIPRWLIQWCPYAEPATAPEWFTSRGAKLVLPSARWWQPIGAEAPPPIESDLSVIEVGPESRALFGDIVTSATGIESALQPLVSSFIGHPDWRGYLVIRGSTAVAAGALFVSGRGAWLGLAGTLPSDRNHGAQRLLIRQRLADARAMGCAWTTSETALATLERPNASHRNMEREHFQLAYVRQTYLIESASNMP